MEVKTHLEPVVKEIMKTEEPEENDLGAISCLRKCPLLASTGCKPSIQPRKRVVHAKEKLTLKPELSVRMRAMF